MLSLSSEEGTPRLPTATHMDQVFCWVGLGVIDLNQTPENIWGFPKIVGFPNKPIGFPTKHGHFGVEIGVPPF